MQANEEVFSEIQLSIFLKRRVKENNLLCSDMFGKSCSTKLNSFFATGLLVAFNTLAHTMNLPEEGVEHS